LNVSKNTLLTRLECMSNQLTSLDVTKNNALNWLDCRGNQLTRLDISANTKLANLILTYMPSLYKVCVWIMPFPPTGVTVDKTGSPNVFFTTDCSK